MTWLRIDDGFAEHRKILDLSDPAFRLHVNALCFCARNLTDGFVSQAAATRCYAKPKPLIAELVKARLWSLTAGGYQIHDYLTYNPTRAQVESDRQKARERMSNVRANIGRTSPEVRTAPYPVPVPEERTSRRREGLRHIGEALR